MNKPEKKEKICISLPIPDYSVIKDLSGENMVSTAHIARKLLEYGLKAYQKNKNQFDFNPCLKCPHSCEGVRACL